MISHLGASRLHALALDHRMQSMQYHHTTVVLFLGSIVAASFAGSTYVIYTLGKALRDEEIGREADLEPPPVVPAVDEPTDEPIDTPPPNPTPVPTGARTDSSRRMRRVYIWLGLIVGFVILCLAVYTILTYRDSHQKAQQTLLKGGPGMKEAFESKRFATKSARGAMVVFALFPGLMFLSVGVYLQVNQQADFGRVALALGAVFMLVSFFFWFSRGHGWFQGFWLYVTLFFPVATIGFLASILRQQGLKEISNALIGLSMAWLAMVFLIYSAKAVGRFVGGSISEGITDAYDSITGDWGITRRYNQVTEAVADATESTRAQAKAIVESVRQNYTWDLNDPDQREEFARVVSQRTWDLVKATYGALHLEEDAADRHYDNLVAMYNNAANGINEYLRSDETPLMDFASDILDRFAGISSSDIVQEEDSANGGNIRKSIRNSVDENANLFWFGSLQQFWEDFWSERQDRGDNQADNDQLANDQVVNDQEYSDRHE